jgi:hypothetical protein
MNFGGCHQGRGESGLVLDFVLIGKNKSGLVRFRGVGEIPVCIWEGVVAGGELTTTPWKKAFFVTDMAYGCKIHENDSNLEIGTHALDAVECNQSRCSLATFIFLYE